MNSTLAYSVSLSYSLSLPSTQQRGSGGRKLKTDINNILWKTWKKKKFICAPLASSDDEYAPFMVYAPSIIKARVKRVDVFYMLYFLPSLSLSLYKTVKTLSMQ